MPSRYLMITVFTALGLWHLGTAGLLVGANGQRGTPAQQAWVFSPPHRPTVPVVKARTWVANPIDAFVLAKLEANGLSPSQPANKLMLLRRVTFDLTGLPPAIEEQEAFLADHSP